MRRMIAVSVVAAVFCGLAALADDFVCGTSVKNDARLAALDSWVRERVTRDRTRLDAAPAVEVRSDTVILGVDGVNSPFRRPIDLAGKSLEIRRESDGTYSSRLTDLQSDSDYGLSFGGSKYTLTKFSFPFYDRTLTSFTISPQIAIFPDGAPAATSTQWGDLETATSRKALIAPLWQSFDTHIGTPRVFVKESNDSLTMTWTAVNGSFAVQAALFRTGDLRFSYIKTDGLVLGLAGITSGTESRRDQTTALAQLNDAANDVSTKVKAVLSPMLDVRSVAVRRVADSDLVEFEIKVAGNIDRSVIPAGEGIYYAIATTNSSAQTIYAILDKDTVSLQTPEWGDVDNSPAVRVSGSSIIVDVLQESLPTGFVTMTVAARQLSDGSGDSVSGTIPLDPAPRAMLADLHQPASSSSSLLLTPFTLPIFNPGGAWSEVKTSLALNDTDWDAVAFYQNYPTDIILYASAYSTGGNSQATGLRAGDSAKATQPRAPALLHMNQVLYGANVNDLDASHVVMHELGHRWLYFISIMENGQPTKSLNPLSAHPAQYVHTPAAFNIYTDRDASVMGGGNFVQNNDGTFTSGPKGYYGYSWPDLYLMGLAYPTEVQPWYYISNSNPALGGAYYPPPSSNFSGTKVPVTLQQVIDAVGTRKPAYPETQRTFRVLFVLVNATDSGPAQGNVTAMANYRRLLETDFPRATGQRASVTTSMTLPQPGPRRRAAKH